jgi:hypothetical protein
VAVPFLYAGFIFEPDNFFASRLCVELSAFVRHWIHDDKVEVSGLLERPARMKRKSSGAAGRSIFSPRLSTVEILRLSFFDSRCV